MATSPDDTRQKEITSAKSLSYPLNEDLNVQLALRFVKYTRYANQDTPSEDTTTVIFLPLPSSIPENINIRVEQDNLGWLGALGKDFADIASELGQAPLTEQLKNKIMTGVKSADAAGVAAMLAPGSKDSLNVRANFGKIFNPHTTAYFNGVSLRSFTLSWRFSPRSQEEAQRLKDIFDEIEMRIHPEEIAERLVLDYPDIVYVDFIGDDKHYFPKYRKAFISAVQKGFQVQLYSDLAPIEQEYSISFNEIETVTRNVLRGDSGTSNGRNDGPSGNKNPSAGGIQI